MSERPDYPSRFNDPHPQSYLAFAIAAAEILSTDPSTEVWMRPIDVDAIADERDRRWAERVNPILRYAESRRREDAINELRSAGVAVDDSTMAPEIARLIDKMTSGARAAELIESFSSDDPPPRSEHFDRAADRIVGLCSLIPAQSNNARFEEVSRLVNRDVPRNAHGSLSRHNVRRAHRRYYGDLLQFVNQRVLKGPLDAETYLTAELLYVDATAYCIEKIYREARRLRLFPGLSGAGLAHAIEREHDLRYCFDRALSDYRFEPGRRRCASGGVTVAV